MTNDIVTRLRNDCFCGFLNTPCSTCQAADEIERLRKEQALWKMTAEHLARQLGKMEYAETTYQDILESIKGTNK